MSSTPNTPPSAEEMANDLERAVEQHRRRESPRGSMSMHETYVVRLIEALRTRSENARIAPTFKLPLRYEHISYEGDFFYDADNNDVTAEQIVEYVNGK